MTAHATATAPWHLRSTGGLTAVLTDGGAPASLAAGGLELVQHAASAFEAACLQLWLRDRGAGRAWPLLGPGTGGRARVDGDRLVVAGRAADLAWTVHLTLDPTTTAWAWHVEVVNTGPGARVVDVVHAHDVALAGPGVLRTNELYVSQYLDVRPLPVPTGVALAVRQNLAQDGRHPWCVLASTHPVEAWATDSLDVHGWSARTGRDPGGPVGDLSSRRLQHEHTLATLQTAGVELAPGATLRVSFAGLLLADHPTATSDDDARHAAEALTLARAAAPWAGAPATEASSVPDGGAPPEPDGVAAPGGVYARGREARSRALTEEELAQRWPGPWRAVERDDAGTLLSFFTDDDVHVVTLAKELAVLRPHGTILRTGATAVPDPEALAVTAWMTGSPLSYLTRGHASSGRVLTTVRGYLGLHRAYGARVLVEAGGRWRLLDLPSAFAMRVDEARWTYVLEPDGDDPGGTVDVRTTAPAAHHHVELAVDVTDGPARAVLVALHLAAADEPLPATAPVPVRREGDGVVVGPTGPHDLLLHVSGLGEASVGDDAPLFDDGAHRVEGVVTLAAASAPLRLRFAVAVAGPGPDAAPHHDLAEEPHGGPGPWWSALTALRVEGAARSAAEVEPVAVSLPWLVRDALVHHLAPRGLEQYTGGAWGTRDVTQGPLELLLALDRLDDARALLLQVFAAQNADGTWPQAFGFLPGDEHFRMEPPHGDVVHWPVLAVGRYLLASGDPTVLDVPVAWYAPPGTAARTPAPLREHVLAAVDRAAAGTLPGTHLVAYGHGDWNDSLQPADPVMARTMVSAWTVTLHHQSLVTLADGLDAAGRDGELAAALRAEADAVATDLHRHLLVDGELAGYALLDPPRADGRVTAGRLLVHPRDETTGLRHGALQMIHALGADLLDTDQAAHHVALVREHLMGVDGVRLFDRPPAYRGGTMRHFQRAETATFVGREIGLMYVHAHLRWCEAMARWGDPVALWLGVRQVLPAATGVVPGARLRQANTYPSSSDAAVRDRDDFAARYADVLTGATGLEGGWRIYSSGPGVLLRVLVQSLLGVRRRAGVVELDPVLPAHLDGLTAAVPLAGGLLRVRYAVGARGHGPVALRLGGRELDATRVPQPYRTGGLAVPLDALRDALAPGGPVLEVELP